MERRQNSSGAKIEIRTQGDKQTPVITGYAARYYDPNDPGTEYRSEFARYVVHERIMPGAFNRAIQEDDAVGLFNHDPNLILGRKSAGTLSIRSDDRGLVYEIVPPDSMGHVVEAIKRGDVTGSSFAFSPRTGGQVWRDAEINGKEVTIRELTDVKLYDVSPVVYPAYGATTAGVRSDVADLEKEFMAWLSLAVDERAKRSRRARAVEIISRGT